MKKLMIAIATLAMLTACGTAPTQTVVVDQNGKVIETKSSFNGLGYIGKIPMQSSLIDPVIYQDSGTGCKYLANSVHGGYTLSPYYNADGQVDGCKNTINK